MTTTPAEFETALAAYLAKLNESAAKASAARELGEAASFATDGAGRAYVRIVRSLRSGRSAYSFVERATGMIYKPAGWKGPVKNFARGSVYAIPENLTGDYGL